MNEAPKHTRPIKLPVVDVVGITGERVHALRTSAAAIRVMVTNDNGATEEFEFVIAGRTAADCDKAIQGFKHWGGDALDLDSIRDVVILQAASVTIDEEL